MDSIRKDNYFFDLHSLLPELITYVLFSVFLDVEMAHEFPKLFCVCKFWVEHLDIAEIHQAVGM
jgi:hypothetical protein